MLFPQNIHHLHKLFDFKAIEKKWGEETGCWSTRKLIKLAIAAFFNKACLPAGRIWGWPESSLARASEEKLNIFVFHNEKGFFGVCENHNILIS